MGEPGLRIAAAIYDEQVAAARPNFDERSFGAFARADHFGVDQAAQGVAGTSLGELRRRAVVKLHARISAGAEDAVADSELDVVHDEADRVEITTDQDRECLISC